MATTDERITWQAEARRAARHFGISEAVFLALLNQEFGWNPHWAYGPDTSSAGAGGAGQFMPATWSAVVQQHSGLAREHGVTANPRDRFKPIGAIWMSAAHFRDLLRSGGSYTNALIGYNAGPGWFNTDRADLPQETQRYLSSIAGMVQQMGADIGSLFGRGGGGVTNGNGDDYSGFLDGDGDGGDGLGFFFEGWLQLMWDQARERGDRETMLAIERLRQQGDIASIRLQHELQFDPRLKQLSEDAAELEIRIARAREEGQRETELLLLRERAKLDEEAAKANFARDLWLTAVDQAFQERQTAIGELGATERQFMEQQQRGRELLAETQGQDPFRSAIAQQGGVAVGRTPASSFRRQLENVAYRSPPQVNLGGSAQDIRRGIEQYRDRLQPPRGQLGFAGGGEVITLGRDQYRVVEDSREPDIAGPTGIGLIVGEGSDGRGLRDGTAELVELTPDKVRIIPIHKRAAGGMEVQLGVSGNLGARGLATTAAPTAAPPVAAPPARQIAPPIQAPQQAPQAQPAPAAPQGQTLLGQPPLGALAATQEQPGAGGFEDMSESELIRHGWEIAARFPADPTQNALILLQVADELERRGSNSPTSLVQFRLAATTLQEFASGLRTEQNARDAIQDIVDGRPPRAPVGQAPGQPPPGPGPGPPPEATEPLPPDLHDRSPSVLIRNGLAAMGDGIANPSLSSQLLLQIAQELETRSDAAPAGAEWTLIFRLASQVLQDFLAGVRTEDNARQSIERLANKQPALAPGDPGAPGPGQPPPGPGEPPPGPGEPPGPPGPPGGPFSATQEDFINNLLAEWPPDSRDALAAQQLDLPEISEIILAHVGGFMTDEEARAAILHHLYGGGDPTTVLTDFQFAERFVQQWPAVDMAAWAQAAGGRGLTDMQGLLLDYLNNRISLDDLALALRRIFPGLQIPGATAGLDFDPEVMLQAISRLWRHLGFEGGAVTARQGALGEFELQPPQFGQTNIEALSAEDRTWLLELGNRISSTNYVVALTDLQGALGRGMTPVGDILRMVMNGDLTNEQAKNRIVAWQQEVAGRDVAQTYRTLGVAPKLYRDADSGQVYAIIGGQLRQVTSAGLASGQELAQLGIDPSQIIDMPWPQIAQLAPLGAPMQAGENLEEFLGAVGPTDQPFPLMGSPLVEPVTGAVLPAPRAIASIINQIDPTTRELVLTAYESAGMSRETLFREAGWFRPTGTFSGQRAALG